MGQIEIPNTNTGKMIQRFKFDSVFSLIGNDYIALGGYDENLKIHRTTVLKMPFE
ncbi:MAG: hypothetical protein V4614_09325 [Pseudomonadota bacterium]